MPAGRTAPRFGTRTLLAIVAAYAAVFALLSIAGVPPVPGLVLGGLAGTCLAGIIVLSRSVSELVPALVGVAAGIAIGAPVTCATCVGGQDGLLLGAGIGYLVANLGRNVVVAALLSRLVRPRPKADHLHVTVYTRKECCCCHKARDLLEGYRRRHGFTVEEVDIDADPALVAAHGEWVPVVAIGGKVRFRGVVNPVLLERLLRA